MSADRKHFLRSCAAVPIVLIVACSVAVADDWPFYGHDNARSGVTPETMQFPLHEQWVYEPSAPPDPAWADPHVEPVEGALERNKTKFDDVFHVVSADGRAYFGSTSDNSVRCLDQATGEELWRFFTGGPVRLAPALQQGRVYFGSDDGWAYCLDAQTGAVIWQIHGAAQERAVLGHGHMISVWPLRTGLLVDGDVAYLTAGVFPGERIYIRAVKTSDGSTVWTNDTMSDRGAGNHDLAPQGYLLASDTELYVPSGRNLPAAFKRNDGSFVFQRNYGRWDVGPDVGTYASLGGSYALLDGDHLYVGSEFMAAYDKSSGNLGFAWFPGKRLRVTAQVSYMLEDTRVTALDRIKYPELSRKRRALAAKRSSVAGSKAPDKNEQLAAVDEDLDAVREEIEACNLWVFEGEGFEDLIIAGNAVIIGATNAVIAVDRASGKELWRAPVEGLAKGLSLANGSLFVSTTSGKVYTYAAGQRQSAHIRPGGSEGFTRDNRGPLLEAAAEKIITDTGIKRGFCLVLGSEDGRLAAEIAKQTDLSVYALAPSAEALQKQRERLNALGLLGSRVNVDVLRDGRAPYSDYFANLIVSESAILRGEVGAPAEEIERVLKPCGGVLCLGSPPDAPLGMTEAGLNQWLSDSGVEGAQVTRSEGVWATYKRGVLPGAGSWTHQYGDAGNTASSDDTIMQCPLEVLWYGEPGPDKVPSRHAGNAAPLSINGRVFLEGINEIMCFDAYNGLMYWDRKIPGASRTGMVNECGNLACDEESLFLLAGAQCLRLSQETGETLATYEMPKVDEEKRTWKYIATAGGLLFGSSSKKALSSDVLFAVDIASGKHVWVHKGTDIRNNAIAIDEGRVFFPDMNANEDDRRQALAAKIKDLAAKGMDEKAALQELSKIDVRVAYALDGQTGAQLWRTPVDLTGCAAHVLTGMANNGVYVFCASHNNGHYWPQFLGGEYESRAAVALSTKDGSLLWAKPLGYRIRPLIVGDELIAEPWSFDLHTGEQKMRANPITGLSSKWQFERPGHHCGTVSASPKALYFRSWSFAYYDLLADQGTEHFAGQRPGCWINMIPANGLLVVPEASSGCVCLVSIHATTVLKPSKTHRAWGLFSDPGKTTPVKALRLNLGGPGDRAASDGKLWLSYPRPWGRMKVDIPLTLETLPGCGAYNAAAEDTKVTGTPDPWLYASGYTGVKRLRVPLVGPADGPAVYTVRMHFADLGNTPAGTRVFDIKLQGKPAIDAYDPIADAGGPNRATVLEFTGIRVDDALTIDCVPKAAAPDKVSGPAICAVEILRERVLNVGISAPGVTLSDLDASQTVDVRLANYTDSEFTGTLNLVAPDAFAVEVTNAAVSLKPGATATVPVRVGVARKGPKANFDITYRLTRADGAIESERRAVLEYLGARGRKIIYASEDTYVSAGAPGTNYGQAATILVDGGNATFGDESHNIGYLRFPLDIPGRPVSAVFRIHVPVGGHTQSADSGRLKLVTDPWEEYKITFANRPKPGRELANVGKIDQDEWVERKLDIDLTGLKELSVCMDPTGNDGASYDSRETKAQPHLVVEYEAAE